MPRPVLSDPLLAFARIALVIVSVLLWIVAGAIALALPFLILESGALAEALAAAGDPIPFWQFMAGMIVFLVGILGVVLAIIHFVRLLGRIVDSVGLGDPFVPENADRLTIMAWIALGTQAASFLLELLGFWLGAQIPEGLSSDNWNFTVDGDLAFSPEGVLLALVLFILARVFRKGTEMRDDLEGTV